MTFNARALCRSTTALRARVICRTSIMNLLKYPPCLQPVVAITPHFQRYLHTNTLHQLAVSPPKTPAWLPQIFNQYENEGNEKTLSWLKEDRSSTSLVEYRDTKDDPVGLDPLLAKTYEHFRIRQERICTLPASRENNPIFALQGAPGTGKTFFLNALLKSDPNKFCNKEKNQGQEVCNILSKSVRLGITFNGGTPIRDSDLVDEYGIAARIACAYLFNKPVAIDTVYAVLAREKKGIEDVVGHIINTHGSLLLCVDELAKLGAHRAIQILSRLGGLTDLFHTLHVVVSSLSMVLVADLTPASGRPVCWLPLYKPTILDIMSLINIKDPRWRKSQVIRRLVFMCGGHWRPLGVLFKVINNVSNGKFEAPTENATFVRLDPVKEFINEDENDYADSREEQTLYAELLIHLRKSLPTMDIPLDLVKVALAGNSVRLLQNIANKLVTEWIVHGTLINTTSEQDLFSPAANWPRPEPEVVPTLSPLALYAWATRPYNQLDHPQLCKCIEAMLSALPMDSDSLEIIQARWEELQHLLKADTSVSILEYYTRSSAEQQHTPSHSRIFDNERFYIDRKKYYLDEKRSTFSLLWTGNKIDVNKVLCVGSNNPGFDIVLFARVANSDTKVYVPIFIECHKGIKPRTLDEIERKIELTKEVYSETIANRGTWSKSVMESLRPGYTIANPIYVFVEASREPNAPEIDLTNLNLKYGNCILISSSHWRLLMSPSLAYGMDLLH